MGKEHVNEEIARLSIAADSKEKLKMHFIEAKVEIC